MGGGWSKGVESSSGGRGICAASFGEIEGEGEEGESCLKGSISSDWLKEELMVVGSRKREGRDRFE